MTILLLMLSLATVVTVFMSTVVMTEVMMTVMIAA